MLYGRIRFFLIIFFVLIGIYRISESNQLFSNTWYRDIQISDIQRQTGASREVIEKALHDFHHADEHSYWRHYYHVIPEMIRTYGLQVGCEVGVAFGMHSQVLLEKTQLKKLYSVDPYKHFNEEAYVDDMNLSQDVFDVYYYLVSKRLAPFGDRSVLLRKTSVEAAAIIADNELDFVFIDANHSYEAVKEDLALWYKKVRPGGFIIGDDYTPAFPGVIKAVNEFCSARKIQFGIRPDAQETYWFQKPNDSYTKVPQSNAQHFLSFIMPCYNAEDTVIEALDSIYKQKLSVPFEIICTDDGSQDATKALLIEYAQDHPEVKVFIHKKNQGGGPARNTCVSHARGDLIFNLDADNVLAPNSVQKLIDLLDYTKADGAAFEEIRFFRGRLKRNYSVFYKTENGLLDVERTLQVPEIMNVSGNYLSTKESYMRLGNGSLVASHARNVLLEHVAKGMRTVILPGSFYWYRLPDNMYYEPGI
jgi:hypothetical protein